MAMKLRFGGDELGSHYKRVWLYKLASFLVASSNSDENLGLRRCGEPWSPWWTH